MSSGDEEMKNYVSQALETLWFYDPKKTSFTSWKKKFLQIVRRLNVPKSKKSEFFCSMLELKILNTLRKKLKPRDPTVLPYKEVEEALKKYIVKKAEIKKNRKKFNARKQRDGETIEMYAKKLEHLYRGCKYKYVHDSVLVKKFLEGLKNRNTAYTLDKKNTVEFENMVERAIEYEASIGASTSTIAWTITSSSSSTDASSSTATSTSTDAYTSPRPSTSAGPSTSTGAYTSPGPSTSAGPSTRRD